jgi:predicted Zn-dependent protease
MTPEQRLATFRSFVAQRPDDPFARYSLAMALRSAGQGEAAAAEFQELRRRAPEYVPGYLMLGQVLGGLGRKTEAAQAYQDGIAAAERRQDGHARSELAAALETLRQEGYGTR